MENFGMEKIGKKENIDHKSNKEFWINRNRTQSIERDQEVNRTLRKPRMDSP